MRVQKILLVEDQEDIRDAAVFSLAKIGKFDVVTAESGAEGLELARTEHPDIIISDVIMPGMEGPDLCVCVRGLEETKRIPVIFMTASDGPEENEKYRVCGAAGFIAKPFDPMRLAEQVRAITDGL